MKLRKLLKDFSFKDIKGSKDIEITGLCSNSKLVAPGNLFFAKKGFTNNGAQYISEAIEAGAIAVVTDIYDPSFKNITQIIHPNPAAIEASFVEIYYHFVSQELFVVGVTGTNGKTTSSYLIKHLLDHLEIPCGLLGTIEYIIGEHRYQAIRTTPDLINNHKMLREMVNQGCKSAVMEVTSHALDQGRVEKIDFDVAVFTNLTLDHLDYHKTMEEYALAKRKLFQSLSSHQPKKREKYSPTAVINLDSPWYKKMVEGCKAHVLTYGMMAPADLTATEIQLDSTGTKFNINYQGKTLPFSWSLIGRFNIYNCLAAIAIGIIVKEPLEKIVEILRTFTAVSGRLEVIPNALGLKIFVDFAHTPDALINVMSSLKELKEGRLITVFGCGGERDQSKRPKMAEACEEYADFSFVTSDNPRSENPETICQQIVKGFKKQDIYKVEIDRRKAIESAIKMATPSDIVLIAGKGHETYQVFAHKTIEFDDRKVAESICQAQNSKQYIPCS